MIMASDTRNHSRHNLLIEHYMVMFSATFFVRSEIKSYAVKDSLFYLTNKLN